VGVEKLLVGVVQASSLVMEIPAMGSLPTRNDSMGTIHFDRTKGITTGVLTCRILRDFCTAIYLAGASFLIRNGARTRTTDRDTHFLFTPIHVEFYVFCTRSGGTKRSAC